VAKTASTDCLWSDLTLAGPLHPQVRNSVTRQTGSNSPRSM
jgi:hypothetical protein